VRVVALGGEPGATAGEPGLLVAPARDGAACFSDSPRMWRRDAWALFALEVSRLTRSSADWHRLLELCGLADVVIVDEQAVYTPRDYNDRLLLGYPDRSISSIPKPGFQHPASPVHAITATVHRMTPPKERN
jgi:hypothetical protein